MTVTSGVIATNQPDGSLLLDIDGYQLRCNAIGREIWERLRDGRPFSAIVDDIAATFHMPRSVVEEDVSTFVQRLRENLLVQD